MGFTGRACPTIPDGADLALGPDEAYQLVTDMATGAIA